MNKKALLEAIFGKETNHVPSDEEVAEVLSTLAPREIFILERRFADQRMTLKAIGEVLPRRDGGIGVTREVVRAAEAKALRKLRHPSRSRQLRPYLERPWEASV